MSLLSWKTKCSKTLTKSRFHKFFKSGECKDSSALVTVIDVTLVNCRVEPFKKRAKERFDTGSNFLIKTGGYCEELTVIPQRELFEMEIYTIILYLCQHLFCLPHTAKSEHRVGVIIKVFLCCRAHVDMQRR